MSHDPDVDLALSIIRRYGDASRRVASGNVQYTEVLDSVLEQAAMFADLLTEGRAAHPDRWDRAVESGVLAAMLRLREVYHEGVRPGVDYPTVERLTHRDALA